MLLAIEYQKPMLAARQKHVGSQIQSPGRPLAKRTFIFPNRLHPFMLPMTCSARAISLPNILNPFSQTPTEQPHRSRNAATDPANSRQYRRYLQQRHRVNCGQTRELPCPESRLFLRLSSVLLPAQLRSVHFLRVMLVRREKPARPHGSSYTETLDTQDVRHPSPDETIVPP